MEQTDRIAILGGTGKAGKYLVKELLNRGIPVRMLVRNRSTPLPENPLMEVVEGDVRQYAGVRDTLSGCRAVISTLGLGVPPSEPTLFSQATTNVLQAMEETGVTRYMVITGLNVDTPSDKKSSNVKQATEWMYANFPKSTADKQKEYNLLSESTTNWTMVRLPLIEQTNARGPVNASLENCCGEKISAASLADFLIGQLSDSAFIQKAPFVANA